MNAFPRLHHRAHGSAFIVVVIFIGVFALLTASLLKYSVNERRANERQRLILRARNMAENVAVYASEQVTTKLYRLRNLNSRQFASGSNAIVTPPSSVLTTKYSTTSDVELYGGIRNPTALALVTDTSNSNYGLQVATAEVPIIAKSTMTHPAIGSVSAYVHQDLQITEIPLFQFAIFYNQDLEFSPGADMKISGPVHANGNLIARGQTGFSNTVQFYDRVTASGGYYADTSHKGTIYNEYDGADDGPGGTGPVYFQNPAGTVTNINNGSIWRDHLYGTSTESATTRTQFKTFATSTYNGNLRTSAHSTTQLVLPGIDNSSTNSGRYLIEPPSSSDTAGMIQNKFSRRAGLYIIVNPDTHTRNGTLPDGTLVSMRARSYRCWLNTTSSAGSHTLYEVVLPGQPSYGDGNTTVNDLPNAYRTDTSVGSNQVLRIPKGGGVDRADTGYAVGTPTYAAFQDAFFYDLRRATNSNGHPFNRGSNSFTPRPISKIDFDLARFRMAVERTLFGSTSSTVFSPARPNATNWSSNVLNPSASAASYGLGLGATYNAFSGLDAADVVQRSQGATYGPATININGYKKTGAAGTIYTYSGRFVIAETTSANPFSGATWTDQYTSSADQSSLNYTPSAGITGIRIQQYLGGAAPTAARRLDEQIVPITDDTTATITASLSNDFSVIPNTATGTGFLLPIATEMKVYVGGDEDTDNWSFSVPSWSANTAGGFGATSGTILSTGYFGNGTGYNRFWLTGISTTLTTGTVTIRATKGATTIDRVFTWVKQSSIAAMSPNNDQSLYWIGVSKPVAPDPFQIYFANTTPTAVSATSLFSTASVTPWFDGITVYIHSTDAEVKTTTGGVLDRTDSGVRLINGRGPVVSITTSGYTGVNIATNDALYIVGHFNADGNVNSTTSSTGTGGYSGRYPESASEYLVAVMSDAITIMSQPEFAASGSGTAASPYTFAQSGGWTDSLSAHIRSNPSSYAYNSSWQTTNPGTGNTMDGVNSSVAPASTPFQGNLVGGSGSARTYKFPATETEVSACLLTGIVPTDSHQHSGGVHNYPRLLESWSGTGLYIRGGMVAMFNSEVATEPWSIRIYNAPGRYWGLHENLRSANHDVPLEPIVLNAERLHFSELTAAEYAALKTAITGL